jgi:circadian clock protein KaiC
MSQSGVASTGIAGLDDILNGGLPHNHVYLVQGDPGVGKTTLALQFLVEGIRVGEPSMYIALSETEEEVRAVAASHGWDIEALHLHAVSALEQSLQTGAENTLFVPSDVELHEAMRTLLEAIDRVKPVRLVFDSLSELRLLSQDALRYRRQILLLKEHLTGRLCTALLLDDRTIDREDRQLHSLTHGVIALSQVTPEYGVDRRRVRVVKLRGVNFRSGQHDYVIHRGGLVVYPRLVASEHKTVFVEGQLQSGILELDRLMGGGIDRGSSTLVVGPAGTGKSILTTRYLLAAAEQQENSVVFHFDENLATMRRRSQSVGMDVDVHLASGRIAAQRIDSVEMSPGAFDALVRKHVEQRQVRVVVIDSLNGYLSAMSDERFLNIQLHELLNYLAQKGVCTFIVVVQQGMLGNQAPTIDISYLADSVILLRNFETHGALHKAISVVKRRSGAHENTIRQLSLGPAGIVLGEPLREFQGVLTGVPSYLGTGPPRDEERDGHGRR